jgi:hypothetical protein
MDVAWGGFAEGPMLKKILGVVAVLVVAFAGFVATRPATYHVERSKEIRAPAEVVFAQLDDFRAWPAWSPWEKLDPGMKKTYEGPERSVGSSYAWQGNSDVGKGKMTITDRHPSSHLGLRLEFLEPFASTAATDFRLRAAGDAVNVTWSMEGNNDFMGKLFGTFMDMDAMIGADYEKGLAALATVSEAEAKRQVEAAAAEKARVEAAAQAEADDDDEIGSHIGPVAP